MEIKKMIYAGLFLFVLMACHKDDDHLDVITPENIPDETFFDYLLNNFDLNKDGKLSVEEANAVKEIIFIGNDSPINSIKGIEYFRNLEKLSLANILYYDLETVNLNNNTALKELSINHTGIAVLDVSQNTALEILDCNSNQSLKTLNLGNNTALKYLNCSETIVDAINVTDCKSLEILNMKNTYVVAVNINENNALKELDCSKGQGAYTYNNYQEKRIQELNISNNPALKMLKCNSNAIEDLDIANNPLLETLHCNDNKLTRINVSQNPELRDLDISDNEIAFLNFTQNTKLRKLFCSETKIDFLDIRNTVIDSLSCSSSYLKSLNAKGSRTLKMLECSSYAEIIDASESTIETIKYDSRSIHSGHDFAGEATLLLNDCPDLKAFYYSQVDTYPRGTIYIVNSGKISMNFSNCRSLQSFNANYISDLKIDNCPELKDLTCIGVFAAPDLSNNSNLEKLFCYDNALETIDITSCAALKDIYCFGMFKTIDFSGNRNVENLTLVAGGGLSSLDIDALTNLKFLDLTLFDINSTFKIHKNTALEEIIIRDTMIYGAYPREMNLKLDIADLPSLKYLKTQSNLLTQIKISNCDKIAFVSCNRPDNYPFERPSFGFEVNNCPALQNIFVKFTSMNHFEVNDCANLDTVDISLNKLTSVELDKSVKYLDCSENEITSLNVSGFTRLKELYCTSNQMNSLDIDGCDNLETLHCSDNNLSSLSIDNLSKLKELYCNKNQISSLDISKHLTMDKVDCTENQIKRLIISNGQAFSVLKKDATTEIVYVD